MADGLPSATTCFIVLALGIRVTVQVRMVRECTIMRILMVLVV
jgi:hypothetical protein